MYKQWTISFFILFTSIHLMCGQQILALDDVLDQAQQSFFVSEARTDKDIAHHAFNLYKAELKPQIGLNALLPNFSKTSREIIQPNGSVAFQSISQNNASASLYASQAIAATGGRVFIQTDLQRFDDFTSDAKLYNGVPIRIGIEQPIFGYNPFKFRNKIEPLRFEAATKQYNIDIENTLLTTVELYFNALIAHENKNIASTNKSVNEKLLNITYERFNLGKVSKDEKIQLEIELKNAQLNSQQAQYAYQFALAELQTFLGQQVDTSIQLTTPATMSKLQIAIPELEAVALANSPLVLAYQRRTLEAQDEVARQKANYGIKTSLFASYGYAKSSEKLPEVYNRPFDEQQVSLSIAIPLMDWGRKKSAVNIAKLLQSNEVARIAQEELELSNSIQQSALWFLQLQSELQLQQSILEKANERAEISNKRYVLGDISITDLTIAQREKDATRRNYIRALRNYWLEYYRLRALTGYDIKSSKNIIYQ